jgi:hypothetical protein
MMNKEAKNQRKPGGHKIERKIRWSVGTDHPGKKKKTDLKVGCCLGPSTATLKGFPGTRGWLLHNIERKIRWSVGYDRRQK